MDALVAVMMPIGAVLGALVFAGVSAPLLIAGLAFGAAALLLTEERMDDVTQAYRSKAAGLADILGTVVSPRDPDRSVIEPWAETISGRILDVGAGTGRWTGHLAGLGHDVEGLEPVDKFVELARRAHPAVPFRGATSARDRHREGVLICVNDNPPRPRYFSSIRHLGKE